MLPCRIIRRRHVLKMQLLPCRCGPEKLIHPLYQDSTGRIPDVSGASWARGTILHDTLAHSFDSDGSRVNRCWFSRSSICVQ